MLCGKNCGCKPVVKSYVEELKVDEQVFTPNVLHVKIKKLHDNAVIPSYSKAGDAGMDMTCVSINITQNYIEYDTGIAISVGAGNVGLLFPRSSNSNKDLLLCNSVGVLDSSYIGSIKFRYKYIDDPEKEESDLYGIGDRVGQLIIIPNPQVQFEEVDSLDETERGEGGFGSSGA